MLCDLFRRTLVSVKLGRDLESLGTRLAEPFRLVVPPIDYDAAYCNDLKPRESVTEPCLVLNVICQCILTAS